LHCAFSWIASLPEEKIIEIFQDGVKKSFQLNEERPDFGGWAIIAN